MSDRLEVSHVDFGAAWRRDRFSHTITLHNRSDAEVRITQVDVSCRCSAVTPNELLILPGESTDVTLDLNLGKADEDHAELETPFAMELILRLQDRSLKRVNVSGNVMHPFALKSTLIQFPENIPAGETGVTRFHLKKHPFVRRIGIRSDDPSVKVVLLQAPHDAEDVYEYALEKAPSGELGRFRSLLQVEVESDDEHAFPPFPVVVSGEVTGDLDWSPNIMLLSTEGDAFAADRLSINSRTATPFSIKAITATDDRIEAFATLETPTSAIVGVTARSVGDREVTLNASLSVAVESDALPVTYSIDIPVVVISRQRPLAGAGVEE